jgi:hypothetical protein
MRIACLTGHRLFEKLKGRCPGGPAADHDRRQHPAGGVDGKSWKKTAAVKVKGKPYPKYYGSQPTGPYPDQPYVRELYYDGATTQILLNGLTRVPQPMPQPPQYPDYLYNNLSAGPNGPR